MSSKVTYRQQYTRCGKQRCKKCREGAGHGPYWYAYWSEKGRTVSKYIGATLPEQVEAARQHTQEGVGFSDPEETPQRMLPPQLRIYLLGQFRVEHFKDGEWRSVDSRTWHRRRARALLGCLLSNPGRRLGREQVMEQLWPDLDIDLAANRLNGAVHELRQILEPEITRPAASRMLRLEREILELADHTQIWVDAEEFEHLIKQADSISEPEQQKQLLEEAATLYRGSYLLEELYSEWATPRRDALQRAWVGLQLHLATIRAEREEFVSAIETLDKLRTADPTNETALQRLMILLTQRDRRGEALQLYRQHTKMLKREYESDPLQETSDLYEALLKGHVPTLFASTKPTIDEPASTATSRPETSPVTPEAEPEPVNFTRPVFQIGRHNQSRLIGRHQEQETMHQLLLTIEQADQPTTTLTSTEPPAPMPSTSVSRPRYAHFILLKGESGIGKTRLAEELSLEAYARGWTVAWSRSYEQEGTIPYRPWTEVLRTLLKGTNGLHDLVTMATRPGQATTAPLKLERLSALLPELTLHTTNSGWQSPPVLHEQERLHLWEATLRLLEVFSTIQPLLLVLDDLHWADESSIELLTYLTHHLQAQRVLIIGTCRDGELAPQHKLRTLMADLQREQAIALLSVLPLTHSQIGSMLAHLPREIIRSIQTQSSGNPFFAEELARYMGTAYNSSEALTLPLTPDKQQPLSTRTSSSLMGASKKSEPAARVLPEAVSAVLERRLSRLSSGCQNLLGKAAVLGGSFEFNQLLPMTPETSEDTVLDLLEEALNAGLLIEEGTGAHITYHFWHPLIISHLYGRLSAARRAQLHRKAAEALRSANSVQPEKVAAAIVHHLSKGGGEPATLAYYAELAGHQAYSLGGYSEAQRYYLQVIQALSNNTWYEPDEPDSYNGRDAYNHIQQITAQGLLQLRIADPQHLCQLLERIAECSYVPGHFDAARHLYECILELRRDELFQRQVYGTTTPQQEQLQHEAQLQALLWREIGNTWASTGDYKQAYDCYGEGKAVMTRAGVSEGAAWACLHLQYGALLRLEGNYHEARRYLQEALAMLEKIVQQRATQSTSSQSSPARKPGGLFAEPHNGTENAYKDLPTRTERSLIGDPLEIGYAHERLGIVAASLGQLTDALEHMHTALSIYEQSELVSEMARVSGNLGAAYITKGEHEAARTYLQRSLELARRSGDLPNMSFIMLNLGDVDHRSGDLLAAESWFRQSLELAERVNDREGISWCESMLAAVQQDLGKLHEAANSILHAIQSGRTMGSERCIRFALVGLADLRIAQAVGTHPLSVEVQHIPYSRSRLLRAQATLQRAIGLEGMEFENMVDGRYLLARVHFLLGQLDDALHLAWQTLHEAQEYEMSRTSGRLYRLLGLILARQGDFDQAIHCFEQALQISRERTFHLDYARTLHHYGLVLTWLLPLQTDTPHSTKQELYQRGLDALSEARALFSTYHAAIDLQQIEELIPSNIHPHRTPLS